MIDKAVASTVAKRVERMLALFRMHFGKPLSVQVSGLLGEQLEFTLPDGQEFTDGERAWLNVFSEGYNEAVNAVVRWQIDNTKRKY